MRFRVREIHVLQRLKSLHRNQLGGEKDNINTLLILALIVLPLLAVIIVFGNEIVEKAKEVWEDVMGNPVQS